MSSEATRERSLEKSPASPRATEERPATQRSRLVLLRRHWALALVCLATLAVRVPLIVSIDARASSDSYFYVTAAKSLAAGHGYSILGHPTAFFPVGWPAFLAALFRVFGSSFHVVMWASLALWVLAAALMYVFGTRMGGRAAGCAAGLLIALDPNLAVYPLRAASETLFVPLLIGACLLLQTRPSRTPGLRDAALAGLLIGAAVLVRSAAFMLPPVLTAWLLLSARRRSAIVPALAVSVVAALVLCPWIARNRVVMHTWALSTNGGYTLWLGDNPGATGGNAVRGHHPSWPIKTVQAEVDGNAQFTAKSLHFIRHDFLTWLGLIPRKAYFLFIDAPDMLDNAMDRQPRRDPLATPVLRHMSSGEANLFALLHRLYPAFAVYHWFVLVAGMIATVFAALRRRPGAALVAVILCSWIAFNVTLGHGQTRYMVSVTPLLAAPIGWALSAAYFSLRGRGGSPVAAAPVSAEADRPEDEPRR